MTYRVVGRTEAGQGGVRAGFAGVEFLLRFEGGDLFADLEATSETVWVGITVDGHERAPVRLNPGSQRLLLARSGDPAEVRLMKLTESWQGELVVQGFETTGTALEPPPATDRRLMFIGDSITCGAGTLAMEPSTEETGAGNSARHAFGKVLERRLGADVHLVSYGGRGVWRDWQGLLDGEIANAPTFFERALPDEPSSAWDHASWMPDTVVVCLGQNDFNVGIPPADVWVPAYVRFLRRIREAHPRAHVWVMNSPMHARPSDAPARDILAAYRAQVLVELADPALRAADFRPQPGTPHDAHPTWLQHLSLADDLEPLLRSVVEADLNQGNKPQEPAKSELH